MKDAHNVWGATDTYIYSLQSNLVDNWMRQNRTLKEEREIAKIHRGVDADSIGKRKQREEGEKVQTRIPGPKSPELSHKMITFGKKYWEDGLGRWNA